MVKILVSVDKNTQTLGHIHNTIGKTDTSLFNPYWIKKIDWFYYESFPDAELDELATFRNTTNRFPVCSGIN